VKGYTTQMLFDTAQILAKEDNSKKRAASSQEITHAELLRRFVRH